MNQDVLSPAEAAALAAWWRQAFESLDQKG
jgi:hypothetical protein